MHAFLKWTKKSSLYYGSVRTSGKQNETRQSFFGSWYVLFNYHEPRRSIRFRIPHLIEKQDWGYKFKLIGFLEHSKQNKLHHFTMIEELTAGSKLVVVVSHRYFCQHATYSSLSRKIFLQFDNCTKENKDRYFLRYVEALAASNMFDTIEVAFLPI